MTSLELIKPAESAGSSLFPPSLWAWRREIQSSPADGDLAFTRRTPCTHVLFPPWILTAGPRESSCIARASFLAFPSSTYHPTHSCLQPVQFLGAFQVAELCFPLNTNWGERMKLFFFFFYPGQLFFNASSSNPDRRTSPICFNSGRSTASFIYINYVCILPGLADCVMLSTRFLSFLSRSSVVVFVTVWADKIRHFVTWSP